MAGDWIPAYVDLADKPEVLRLARRCNLDRHGVVGRLIHFWGWASTQSHDGVLRGVVLDDLTYIVSGPPEFWVELQAVGWLIVDENTETITIPNSQDWISRAGKARLVETRKKQRQRDQELTTSVPMLSRSRPETVPIRSGQKRDSIGTTVQDSTEEKRDLDPTPNEKITSNGAESDQSVRSAQPLTVCGQVVLEFPTTGTPKRPYKLTERDFEKYLELFPGIDVLTEFKLAHHWLETNPTRRKTFGGMPRFLTNWLNRTANSGKHARAGPNGSLQQKDAIDFDF